jgi:hypothetical protein
MQAQTQTAVSERYRRDIFNNRSQGEPPDIHYTQILPLCFCVWSVSQGPGYKGGAIAEARLTPCIAPHNKADTRSGIRSSEYGGGVWSLRVDPILRGELNPSLGSQVGVLPICPVSQLPAPLRHSWWLQRGEVISTRETQVPVAETPVVCVSPCEEVDGVGVGERDTSVQWGGERRRSRGVGAGIFDSHKVRPTRAK